MERNDVLRLDRDPESGSPRLRVPPCLCVNLRREVAVTFRCATQRIAPWLWRARRPTPRVSREVARIEPTWSRRRCVELDEITGAIVDAGLRIHRRFGPGLLESLYEATLACELRQRGLRVERQRLIGFSYDGIEIEDAFRADLLVNDCVIVELKSLEHSAPVHAKQLLTYLRLKNLRLLKSRLWPKSGRQPKRFPWRKRRPIC